MEIILSYFATQIESSFLSAGNLSEGGFGIWEFSGGCGGR